ncbi:MULTISPECIES: efflux RND transporter periplasmic adaptor subunit [unclassified Streptococcus]|uniref:efflux RND transporter periplasmic adaptor subunit n=1 Tax=unclassified Streptococcus TaxID=2608887 RepID=UPI0018A9D072|nr:MULTISPECIES: efflux RND transporter periplasmic adaptor subunit [unclassified Streptococcus]MBF8971042.1 efflux RND transporter periplasmic adaptor subunit [Streptococcus sp. NLN76]MBG9368046.1 efflux RND transporter periplasmic adaptor subunit [Streptococcus sp. NLN64]MBJ6746620.1 efflux RND transporter periplasmic adaptor subunit [Streptococcus sp. 121]
MKKFSFDKGNLSKGKIAIGAGAAVLILGVGGMLLNSFSSDVEQTQSGYQIAKVKSGNVASNTLLTGQVAANREQYVYLDASKGDLQDVLVNVGDYVGVGTPLVQYQSQNAQLDYDIAQRAVNKVDRQIYTAEVYGVDAATGSAGAATATDSDDASAGYGYSATTGAAQQNAQNSLYDLYDSREDAVAGLEKAGNTLNATTVYSTIEGTVVEVNRDVAKSATGASQVLVHIVSEDGLQVKGDVTEYTLPNITKGQKVKITSKVFPGKTWEGEFSYISNYPKNGGESTGSAVNAADSGAKYPYNVTINSDASELKQGFNVSMEVQNEGKQTVIPITALVTEDEKHYVWVVGEDRKAKKVQVTIGSADAENQAITAGLKEGEQVITNPDDQIKQGQEVDKDGESN